MNAVDETKLNDLIGKMLNDIGGAMSAAMVRLGVTLGLYKALREGGAATSDELASRTGCHERYLREWLSHHAASGYLDFDPKSARFRMTPEQAAVFADEDSPVYLTPAFDIAKVTLDNEPKVAAAFRTGGGVGWGDQAPCLFCTTARFFRPGYVSNIVQNWIPALDGVAAKLERGARVADVGCGHGISTIIMADAYPNSEFVGFDFHPDSIAAAREHARMHGVDGRVRFEVGLAKEYPGQSYDLVTFFDCLHDMGDPQGAARHVLETLGPDGTWMIVEPMAQDDLQGNLNPVGRIYYAASTMICVPTSLAQEVGAGLGAQAGEQRLREAVVGGGFTRFRRATETPFNMILEARP